MSQTPLSVPGEVPGEVPGKRQRAFDASRLFFPAAAVLMAVLGVIGFGRFYMHGLAYPGREIAPPIKMLVIAHGVSMSGWLLLLTVQPMLILNRKHTVHMTLGKVGAAVASAIFVLGLWLAVRSAQVTPPEALIWGLSPKQFFAVPLISILTFGTFVVLGVKDRRKPQVHRTMMLLATLSVMGAAVSRIDPLNGLYLGTVWERLFGPFFVTLLIGVLLLAIRSVIVRSVDRPFAIGLIALILVSLVTMLIAPTAAWANFTSMLLR